VEEVKAVEDVIGSRCSSIHAVTNKVCRVGRCSKLA
jgi:hypothetical protein